MPRKIRALGLLSGGLDSMLAGAVLRAQGIAVTFICFVTPFYGAVKAREAAAHLGLPLKEVDLTEKFEPLLYAPPHGFGKGHNPCIDCHALMIREAGAVMAAEGFDFVFTGEVLGQRPMSQNRGSLNLVARESGLEELLLRPLSAKLLKTTRPELEGWVDRERLLNLSGRGRTAPDRPGGGVRHHPLSRPRRRLPADRPGLRPPDQGAVTASGTARSPGPGVAEMGPALPPARRRQGRGGPHPAGQRGPRRPDRAGRPLLEVEDYPGPLVLVIGAVSEGDLQEAAGLAAAYSDAPLGRRCG